MKAMLEGRSLYGAPQRPNTIATSAPTSTGKEATVASLTWVDTTHRISEIVSRSPPLLPILIKCAALSSHPYIAAKIQPGHIMKLSRLQTVDIVQATVEFKSTAARHLNDLDEYNGVQLPSFLAIPKSMDSISFEVVRGSVRYSSPFVQEGLVFSSKASVKSSTQLSVRYKSVEALSKELPRFVKLIKTSKAIQKNTKIVEGHVLEILGIHKPWATRDKYLSCRIDQPDGQVCKLDVKWKGTFDTIPDTKRYNVQDLLRVYRLPVTVRVRDFSPTEWIPQKTLSQLKAIKTLDLNLTIEKEETMEFAMAISQTPSSPSSSLDVCQDPSAFQLMILSKNIDVDFVTSSDMTMNPNSYAEVMTRMGSIGDSMVSTISKDIYLNEYGSPMAVMVPFSDLQPKVYGTPIRVRPRSPIHDESGSPSPQDRRASSHHYIDLDIQEGMIADHDVESEHAQDIEEDEDPYESLSVIQKNAEREKCERLLKGVGLGEYNQSLDDESSTDYTILRSPSAIFPSPNVPNFLRLHRPLTESISHYQVPKNTRVDDEDIYIVEDGRTSEEEEEADVPGIRGIFQERRSFKSRCSDSLPREPPPPVPDRIPSHCLRGHKTLGRAESNPLHMHDMSMRGHHACHTLGPSMKLTSQDGNAPGAMGFKQRNPFIPGPRSGNADTAMSSLLLEMRARQSVRESEGVRVDSECVAEKPEVQPIDDLPPPPLPVRVDLCSEPSPRRSLELPSPPPEDNMPNLAELPIADFPPPLPKRSSSLASLSSFASMTSLASVTSAASVYGPTSMKSATSIDSLTSLASTVSSPENQETVNTVKSSSTINHYPTLPVDRQKTSSVKINRSHSCSPTRLRNLAAARRKLPELPIPEQQPEVPPIDEFNPYEQQPNSILRRPRPSSSGNILEEDREPPPLPPDRACSMENLLRHNEDNCSPQQPPPTPNRHTPTKQSLKSARGRRSYFPPKHSKKRAGPTIPVASTIPIAPIAPRPSPFDMMHSLMSRDRGYPPPPKPREILIDHHVTSSEDDACNDEDDGDYLHPESEMRFNQSKTSSLRSKKRIVSMAGPRNIPTPPTVPTRITKDATHTHPYSSDIKSLKDIPVDIATLSCDQIARALALLNIREDIIDSLKSDQMNGELLKSMSEELLQTQFHMTQFYAIKVMKFVNGWRP